MKMKTIFFLLKFKLLNILDIMLLQMFDRLMQFRWDTIDLNYIFFFVRNDIYYYERGVSVFITIF